MLQAKAILSKYYTKLALIPQHRVTAIASLTCIFVLYTLLEFVLTNNSLLVLFHLLSLFILVIAIVLINPGKIINSKRLSNILLFSLSPFILIEIIFSMYAMYGIIYLASLSLLSIVIVGLEKNCRNVAVLTIATISTQIPFVIFIEGVNVLSILIRTMIIAVSFIGFALFLKSMNRVSRRYSEDVLKLANALTKYWTIGDRKDLETIFENIGEEKIVKSYAIVFHRDKDNPVVLVVPGVHYGPFRTLGSSELPYVIDSLLESRGYKSICFHGVGSHELNIVSQRESIRFASSFVEALISSEQDHKVIEGISRPFRVYSQFKEAFVIPMNGYVFMMISSPVKGGDDIPYEVMELCTEEVKRYGLDDVIVVDAHNVEGPRDIDSRIYVEIVRKALSMSSSRCEDVAVGYAEELVHEPIKGLCNGRIKVFVLKCDGDVYAIVYVYGNNAKPGVREIVRHRLLELGAKDVEFVTADDHTCAGTAFDSPYYCVEAHPRLLKAIERAYVEASKNVIKSKITIFIFKHRVRLMGSGVYKLLKIVDESGKATIKSLLITILLEYMCTTLPVLYLSLIHI